MANAVKFKQSQVPRQNGEQARFKVAQGPDLGATYVITGTPVLIGRGEDCDVMISDLKASRVHVALQWSPQTGWAIKDQGSANGILQNGTATREGPLRSGDSITLGTTTLEFVAADAGTQLIRAPVKSVHELEARARSFQEQKQRVRSFGGVASAPNYLGQMGGGPSSGQFGGESEKSGLAALLPASLNDPKKLFLVVGAAILLGIFLWMPDGNQKRPKPVSSKAEAQAGRDLASYLPPDDALTQQTLRTFFREGFREYNAGNWARAKSQFESVLQISPGHPMATIYKQNCDVAIQKEVKAYLARGKKALSAGRLRSAKTDFEAVMRLLARDVTNDAFIEAKDQLDRVSKALSSEIPGAKSGGPDATGTGTTNGEGGPSG